MKARLNLTVDPWIASELKKSAGLIPLSRYCQLIFEKDIQKQTKTDMKETNEEKER